MLTRTTVADVLALACVRRGRPEVLCGHDRLGHPVRWVHVLEQPDPAALLSGDELVLTTGLQLDRDPLSARAYVEAVESAGAAGLVVELLQGREGTREALRRATSGVAMPVVLLTQRIRFVDVTEQVHRTIVASQVERLERHREVHEVFTQASLDGASVDEVVKTAAALLAHPVLCEDLAGRVVAYAGDDATRMLQRWDDAAGSVAHRGEAGQSAGWLQAPIGVRSGAWGRLVTPEDDDPDALVVLERAAQAIAINRAAERDRSALAQQARAACLVELTDGTLSDDEACTRAAALGLHPAPAYVAVAVRVDTTGDPSPAELQRRTRTMLDSLDAAVARSGAEGLSSAPRAGLVQAVVGLRGVNDAETVEAIAGRLPASPWLRAADRTDRAWWMGVARSRTALLDAVAGLDEAAHVADSAAQSPSVGDRTFYRAADVRLRGLLATYGEAAGGHAFVAAELGALVRPERADDLRLLEQLLECGGNKAELARRAYVSRPTLYARLARIEAELGVPLDDPESRTSLHVAVMLHRAR